jgi:sensory rhodopsin
MNPASIQPADVASGSFLLLAAATTATTVLLIMSGAWVSPRWKLSVALAALVALVAMMHYFIATPVWLTAQQMPVVYRYVDWLVTVPIQVLCLYFFIGSVAAVPAGLFWRLLIASVAMVLARYMGESDLMYPTLGFLIGLILWLYILGEVFFGRLSEVNASSASGSVQVGFFWLRLIVTIGWALYPLCYLVVRLGSGADVAKLMVIYNLADLVNQIAFVLAILATAMTDSARSR